MESMPAAKAGLHPGDVVLRANGEPVDTATFTKLIENMKPDSTLKLDVLRDGKTVNLTVHTERVGRILDVAFSPPINLYAYINEKQPVHILDDKKDIPEGSGLAAGAVVSSIDGQKATWDAVRNLVDMAPDAKIDVTLENGKSVSASATAFLRAVTGYDANAKPKVALIDPDLSASSGLKRHDMVLEVNGQPATIGLLRNLEKNHPGEELTLKVQRPAVLLGLARRASTDTAKLEVSPVSAIGIIFGTKQVFHRYPPAEIVPQAFQSVSHDIRNIVQTIEGLITRKLSVKGLGGPVMIYQITTTSAHLGYSWLLEITAFISVNLAIFNLLPLPILDGGQCVLLAIEGIRRKPLDVRIVERIQQFGLLLIIFLMLMVTVNDIQRWFHGILS